MVNEIRVDMHKGNEHGKSQYLSFKYTLRDTQLASTVQELQKASP